MAFSVWNPLLLLPLLNYQGWTGNTTTRSSCSTGLNSRMGSPYEKMWIVPICLGNFERQETGKGTLVRSLHYRYPESTTAPDYSSVWWGRRSFTIKYNLCQPIQYLTTSCISRPFASLEFWVPSPPLSLTSRGPCCLPSNPALPQALIRIHRELAPTARLLCETVRGRGGVGTGRSHSRAWQCVAIHWCALHTVRQ